MIELNNVVNDQNNDKQNFNERNIVEDHEDQEEFREEYEHNSWTATGFMAELPTHIFKNNLLSSSIRRTILQNEPKNKEIFFTPPDMDKKMWTQMSRSSKEHDKDIRRLLYRTSSALRPLDNTLRFIYASKPEDSASQAIKDAWFELERHTLNTRTLLLDSLSFGNDLRRDQALKSIVPGYKKSSEREEVFGDDLSSIIQKENESSKLFNDAAWQKRRSNQNFSSYPSRTQFNPSINYRPPSRPPSSYRGKKKSQNYQGNQSNYFQGNYNNGGQQTRQSS